jgi:hypothetical protein
VSAVFTWSWEGSGNSLPESGKKSDLSSSNVVRGGIDMFCGWDSARGVLACVDDVDVLTTPPRTASSDVLREVSSGFAILSPPSDWERLRSPSILKTG